MSAEMIKKVENLLKSYREREWKIAVLQHKMKNPVRVTETEVAEAMNYAHGDGQGHTPGRVSNKTLYIALNYKEQAERLNTEAAETIAAELFVLEHEHERLKLYISLIDKREAEVLMLLYSEKESAVNVQRDLVIQNGRSREFTMQLSHILQKCMSTQRSTTDKYLHISTFQIGMAR